MTIGLSTYSFFWRHSSRAQHPMTLREMVGETHRLGASVFQICDYPAVERLSATELSDLHALSLELGVGIELGTRGLRREHLTTYLNLAEALGVSLVRTMQFSGDDRPDASQAAKLLAALVPELSARGVTLALETYEQVPTTALVELIERVDSPFVGICLDVANVIAAYESQHETIELVADFVVNLHVKDFHFVRSEGLVGFELTGTPLGTGDLAADYLWERVRPDERGISQIVEHWLPWQGELRDTVLAENAWTARAVDYLQLRKEVYKSTG